MGLPSNKKRILYLVPDTNLFIQCLPLGELPWSDLGDFEEIRLIVCRPVQREIDNQKNRGNDRVGKRARTAYKLFRNIIVGDSDHIVVREDKPIVKVYLDVRLLPNQKLTDTLDYSKPDDEIVGCLHKFKQDCQSKDIRLLTHDSGPMATADSLSLAFMAISDNWLLQPEHNETEKELVRLRYRVSQLQKAEPQFPLACIDGQGEEIEKMEIEYPVYDPMTDDEISTLIQSLRDGFPQAIDFGSKERFERPASGAIASALGARRVYTPAPKEAIEKYTDQDYPNWIRECKSVFSQLHETLQQGNQQPSLTFVANNRGTRPASDVLIEIESKGDIKVYVPPDCDETTNGQEKFDGLRLPPPPQPPRGHWELVSPSPSLPWLHSPTIEGVLQKALLSRSTFDIPEMVPPIDLLEIGRDSDELYYKTDRPTEPVISFGLECEQWRHEIGERHFDVYVSFDLGKDQVRGAIKCSIHAKNLSKPLSTVIPVRFTPSRVGVKDYGDQLIEDLLRSSNCK